jgi:type II secretory pathway pseudopilin PulG
MPHVSREDGFTLSELLVSTTITLLLMGAAMTTFKNALNINSTGTQLADANQNLRSGTNLLIHDFIQAGRGIPVGGIPIPSGTGATEINRPSPPGQAYVFDNTTLTTLPAITTGYSLGPTVDGLSTDMVTILMVDPLDCAQIPIGAIASDGSSMTLGPSSPWITGGTAVAPCDNAKKTQVGDLVWFSSGEGAIQTVTSVDSTSVYFAASDWFNFNQRGAAQGTIMQVLIDTDGDGIGDQSPAMTIYRLHMLTYYVDALTTPGTPRLTRMENHFGPQALAGVVEDLDITYDLVDGVTNPAAVNSLPFTDPTSGLTYTSNQIRKVNLHVGVRSEQLSETRNDYIRNHLTTSVDVRSLASVSRYK